MCETLEYVTLFSLLLEVQVSQYSYFKVIITWE